MNTHRSPQLAGHHSWTEDPATPIAKLHNTHSFTTKRVRTEAPQVAGGKARDPTRCRWLTRSYGREFAVDR